MGSSGKDAAMLLVAFLNAVTWHPNPSLVWPLQPQGLHILPVAIRRVKRVGED